MHSEQNIQGPRGNKRDPAPVEYVRGGLLKNGLIVIGCNLWDFIRIGRLLFCVKG